MDNTTTISTDDEPRALECLKRPDTMSEDQKLAISQALSRGATLAIYDSDITVTKEHVIIRPSHRCVESHITTQVNTRLQEALERCLPKQKEQAEYVASYSYDYVGDGNLDDLCEYVADKSSDWGFNAARAEMEANIQKYIKESATKE